MIIENYIYNENINNISDILVLYKDGFLNNLLVEEDFDIKINSLLERNSNKVNINQQIITNLDNYISYVKSLLLIDQLLIRYIVSITINNKYNKIFLSNKYYPDYIDFYNKHFNKILFLNYNKNFLILKKYNFPYHTNKELINIINTHKKKAYVYFETINKQNLNLYLNIIDYIESN